MAYFNFTLRVLYIHIRTTYIFPKKKKKYLEKEGKLKYFLQRLTRLYRVEFFPFSYKANLDIIVKMFLVLKKSNK